MKYTPKELKGNVNVSRASPIKQFFTLLGGILVILLAVYVLLGLVVEITVARLPSEIEQRIAKLFSGIYEDAGETAGRRELQLLLDDIVKTGAREEERYRVHLVSSSVANAMALPGGNIVIFSALLDEIESENELAFVLAHELGHFVNRDHLKRLGRGLVLLTISTTLLGQDNSITRLITNSLLNAEMRFSQRQERMADLYALDIINRKYGHVAGTCDFFKKAAEKEKKGRLAYYFTTHPHPEDRIKLMNKRIREMGYTEKEVIPLN